MGKNFITISVRIVYYIISEVITLLGLITFSIELSANFVTFSGVIIFSGNYYIIGYNKAVPLMCNRKDRRSQEQCSIGIY